MKISKVTDYAALSQIINIQVKTSKCRFTKNAKI